MATSHFFPRGVTNQKFLLTWPKRKLTGEDRERAACQLLEHIIHSLIFHTGQVLFLSYTVSLNLFIREPDQLWCKHQVLELECHRALQVLLRSRRTTAGLSKDADLICEYGNINVTTSFRSSEKEKKDLAR